MNRLPPLPRRLTWAALAALLVGGDCQTLTQDIDPNRDLDPNFVDEVRGEMTREFRSIDGTGNHAIFYVLGAAHTPLIREMSSYYADGISAMAGTTRPSPRQVSNAICAQDEVTPNALDASDYLWQWGQFLDHDIDLTEAHEPTESHPIRPETGDPFFDPDGSGLAEIEFHRSIHHPASGGSEDYPRQQVNEITHYIDASSVYGSDEVRAAALRTNDGTGRLKVSEGNLLMFNTEGLPNGGGTGPELFLAGDVRANEQVGLTAMHTLFVREHNRRVAELARDSTLSGDELYERAAWPRRARTLSGLPTLHEPGDSQQFLDGSLPLRTQRGERHPSQARCRRERNPVRPLASPRRVLRARTNS